jgi:hypothetical protein
MGMKSFRITESAENPVLIHGMSLPDVNIRVWCVMSATRFIGIFFSETNFTPVCYCHCFLALLRWRENMPLFSETEQYTNTAK